MWRITKQNRKAQKSRAAINYIVLYAPILYLIMLYHVISCHVISCYIMSCHIMLYHIISHHVMLCHIMLYQSILHHVMLCHIMLHHIIPYTLISHNTTHDRWSPCPAGSSIAMRQHNHWSSHPSCSVLYNHICLDRWVTVTEIAFNLIWFNLLEFSRV